MSKCTEFQRGQIVGFGHSGASLAEVAMLYGVLRGISHIVMSAYCASEKKTQFDKFTPSVDMPKFGVRDGRELLKIVTKNKNNCKSYF